MRPRHHIFPQALRASLHRVSARSLSLSCIFSPWASRAFLATWAGRSTIGWHAHLVAPRSFCKKNYLLFVFLAATFVLMATNALRPIAFLPQMPMKPTAAAHQSSSLPANMQETARMNSAAPSCLNSHPTHVAVNNQRARMFATPISGTRLPFGSRPLQISFLLSYFLLYPLTHVCQSVRLRFGSKPARRFAYPRFGLIFIGLFLLPTEGYPDLIGFHLDCPTDRSRKEKEASIMSIS
jgi:hypothetical protein